jgi:hypothetical protein
MRSTSRGRKIAVLDPRGSPPSISMTPMATRPESLVGRPVYLVDVRFMNGDTLLRELQKVLAREYPDVRTEFRQKRGGYGEDDPALWAEIKNNRGLMVMAIGH